MAIIKLDNVYLEYSPIDDDELEERPKKSKKKKGQPEDLQVFDGFEEIEKQSAVSPRLLDETTHTYALKGVSLEIEEGENIALVGRNGSGKSTLAKLLNGLLLPTIGDVYVNGMNTAKKGNLFEIRKNVGMVFQNPDNQMIASIVEDDIAFGPENIGVPSAEIRARVDWALESVGMSEYKSATPFKLSGGQKQRIAIAGMLAIKPRVLVLDESTAMLDPQGRGEVMEVAKKLNREEKMTVINITHYMDEVTDCDRVIVLDKGAVVLDGTPTEVFSDRHKLAECGLALPNVLQIAQLLRDRGIEIGENTFSVKELVSRIWQLSQKS